MFSATMNPGVKKLSASLLRDPVFVEVAKENSVAADVDHRVLRVKHADKRRLLTRLLEREDYTRALIFVRTRSMTDTIAEDLQGLGYKADSIHGDRKQNIRQKVLRNFTNGKFNVLVATDVAARGLDVKDISHVINFDMPMEADAYIHRVGRTGRAGAKGVALSICSNTDTNLLFGVERLLKQKIDVDMDHPWHDESGGRSNGGKKGKGKTGRKFGGGTSYSKHEPSSDNNYNPNKKFGGEFVKEEARGGDKAGANDGLKLASKPDRKFRPDRTENRPNRSENQPNRSEKNVKAKAWQAPAPKKRKGPKNFDEVFDVDPMAINSLKSKAANNSDTPAKPKKTGKPFTEKGAKFNKAGKFDKSGKPARKLGPRRFKGQKKKQAA